MPFLHFTFINLYYLQKMSLFIFQVFSSIISSIILRRGSRKILFASCFIIIILSTFSIATFSYLSQSSYKDLLDGLGWLPVAFVSASIGAFAIGVFPILQLLNGELYPTDIRSLAIGLTMALARISEMSNVLVYPYLLQGLTFYGAFYLYSCTALLVMIWGILKIPDNRGLTLAKVEEKMSSTKMSLDKNQPNYQLLNWYLALQLANIDISITHEQSCVLFQASCKLPELRFS